jgi:hypothetical protein
MKFRLYTQVFVLFTVGLTTFTVSTQIFCTHAYTAQKYKQEWRKLAKFASIYRAQ